MLEEILYHEMYVSVLYIIKCGLGLLKLSIFMVYLSLHYCYAYSTGNRRSGEMGIQIIHDRIILICPINLDVKATNMCFENVVEVIYHS